jgi:hypothetical protein
MPVPEDGHTRSRVLQEAGQDQPDQEHQRDDDHGEDDGEQQRVPHPAVIEQLAVVGQAGELVAAQQGPVVERHPPVQDERDDEQPGDQDRGWSHQQGAGEPAPGTS